MIPTYTGPVKRCKELTLVEYQAATRIGCSERRYQEMVIREKRGRQVLHDAMSALKVSPVLTRE